MKNCAFHIKKLFTSLFLIILFGTALFAEGDIKLYTPYVKVSVPPGESIDYSVDIINNGSQVQTLDISVTGLSSKWDYSLKAGGYNIRQIAVLPGEKKTMTLRVNVPMKVNKGNHYFKLIAKDFDLLPLIINVSEKGSFKTDFTCDQINMQGHATSNFSFSTKLKNQTGEKQMYSLRADAPRGWSVIFKPNYKQATAVEVDPNITASISIEVKPPHNVKTGTYKIPVQAINNSTSADISLEIVITGSYEMELTTPSGVLNTEITAGKQKQIELLVRNTGSSELENIIFKSSKPRDWNISFRPDTIPLIPAGGSTVVMAIIKASDKAIPGDYVANITSETPEVKSSIAYRISVKTSLLWGWVGILIILGTIGVIYYLFRKYGRR